MRKRMKILAKEINKGVKLKPVITFSENNG
jgi:hypothetical protein